MAGTDPGSAREEAERLVATLLAAAGLTAPGTGAGPLGSLGGMLSGVLGHSATPGASTGPTAGFATGTAECCICPLCRAVAAVRDPSPEFTARLATGAGDLAAGVASFLRAFAPAEPPAPDAGAGSDRPDAGTSADRDSGDEVWREATRTGHDSPPANEPDVWSAATRRDDVAVPAAAAAPADNPGPAAPVAVQASAGRSVVPASRPPGDEGADVPGDRA